MAMYSINDCYAEVYDILLHTDKNLVDKIPNKFLNWLNDNRNKNYKININYEKGIENCNLKRETATLLTIIYKKYLQENVQKDANDVKVEEKNVLKNENDTKFRNENVHKSEEDSQIISKFNNELAVVNKTNWFMKFFKKIKDFFKNGKLRFKG